MAQSTDAEEERAKAMQQRLQALQIEQQKRLAVKKYMTIGAYERLMNVRVANYELYSQLVDLIINMAQSQRVTGQITEESQADTCKVDLQKGVDHRVQA